VQVKHLGFDHFSIYDMDGSTAPYIAPLANASYLSYFHQWSPTPCLANLTSTLQCPYCTETLLENQCVWNARGRSEWVMLVHAPDCFLNDAPGMPSLFGLLDSMDHSKSSLLLPTILFGPATDAALHGRDSACTAADIFSVFTSRMCATLCSYRHVPVFDPHMIEVSRIHEALDGADIDARVYTASPAVHHYLNLFSNRTLRSVISCSSDGLQKHADGSVDMCIDKRLSHVSGIMASFLASVNGTAAAGG
jgi:hypothetical protein